MLESPILYLKGMRILMFQLSGFYCRVCMYGCNNQSRDLGCFRIV